MINSTSHWIRFKFHYYFYAYFRKRTSFQYFHLLSRRNMFSAIFLSIFHLVQTEYEYYSRPKQIRSRNIEFRPVISLNLHFPPINIFVLLQVIFHVILTLRGQSGSFITATNFLTFEKSEEKVPTLTLNRFLNQVSRRNSKSKNLTLKRLRLPAKELTLIISIFFQLSPA